jgi:hypothetical protein
MTRTAALLWFAAFFGATGGAAEKAAPFRYFKTVNNRPSRQEEMLAFELDSDICASTRDRFADLRILDPSGRESPYEIEKSVGTKMEKARSDVASDVLSLKEDGGDIEVRVKLRKDSPGADGMTFAIPLRDYERRVVVYGSEDGQQWSGAITEGLLFDYSRYMDVRNLELRLPGNKYREFRIRVENVVQEKESPFLEMTRTKQRGEETQRVERTTIERQPLRIDGIRLWREYDEERAKIAKTTDYAVADMQVTQDAKLKRTVIQVKSRREPLTRFTLRTSDKNFARSVSVEIPVVEGPRTNWTSVGRSNLMRFSFRSFKKEELTVSFPEQRQTEYRIVIQDDDNPALKIDGVQAAGNTYRAVFLAEPDRSYNVYYGAARVEAPQYEATTVLTAIQRKFEPEDVELGKQAANPAFNEGADGSLVETLNRPWFLVLAVCVMVVVLGWALFYAGTRVRAADGEAAASQDVPSE